MTIKMPMGAMAIVWASRLAFAQAPGAPGTHQLDGSWLVDVRTICAVGGIVLLGTWRIGRWMRRIEDRLDAGDERFKRIEEGMKAREGILARLEHSIARLPCFGHLECQEDKDKKKLPKRSID